MGASGILGEVGTGKAPSQGIWEDATHCGQSRVITKELREQTIESWELGFREASHKSKTLTNVLVILGPGKMSELCTGLTEPAI